MKRISISLWLPALPILLFISGCTSKQTSGSTAPTIEESPETAAKVLGIDGEKMLLHLQVGGKEHDVPFTSETRFLNAEGHELSNPKMEDLNRGFKGVTATVVTEKKDGKEVATRVQARRPGS